MAAEQKNNQQGRIELLAEDLKILENHVQELWHFLPIPACLTNPAFNIVNTSKVFEEASGCKETEIIGENIENFLKSFGKIKQEIAKEKTIVNQKAILLTKEKKEISVNLSIKAREDKNGDVSGYFFAFIDLSEIKEKEEELKRKIKELEQFQRIAVGRELKMAELKREIARLKIK